MRRVHRTDGGDIRPLLALSLVFVLMAGGCARDYVTGRLTLNTVSESAEIQMGREADPGIVAQYGLYDDEELSAYVNRLGQRITKVSQRPQLDYTFRVLDSPVINAFALPGGYVYVTRGILAHFNSEDELAGVVGHEVGHVVARHGAEQMSRAQLAGLGLGLGSIFSETFAQYAGIAQTGVGLLFLSFSRDQESESDRLGVEYATKLGYNAHRMAAFFDTLKRQGEKSGQSLPGFLSTHPDPGDREVTVNALTDEWQRKIDYQPVNTNPDEYLTRIDGIVYGDDPRQGYYENNTFYHPQMKFEFTTPDGWKLLNTPTMVHMQSGDETAGAQLTGGQEKTPAAEADAFATRTKAQVRSREARNVNGFAAVRLATLVPTDGGDLAVLSWFIQKDGTVLDFHCFTETVRYATWEPVFDRMIGSFKTVTDPAVLGRKPVRVRIRQAPKTGTLRSVLQGLGARDRDLEDLAILNGRELSTQVSSGTHIKTISQ